MNLQALLSVLLLTSLALAKQTAPVDIQSTLSGDVSSDDARSVTLTVKPHLPCKELTVSVRSMGGVVVDAAAPELVPRCSPDAPYEKTVTARVPAGVSGQLVVDVTLTLKNGKRYMTSRGFRISRPGSKPDRASSTLSGEPTTDSSGKPVHVMHAAPPVQH